MNTKKKLCESGNERKATLNSNKETENVSCKVSAALAFIKQASKQASDEESRTLQNCFETTSKSSCLCILCYLAPAKRETKNA